MAQPETAKTAPLSRTEIAMRVRGIIADNLGIDVVSCPECAGAADLGLDSLDGAEIALAVGNSFDIELSWTDAARARTVGEFIDLVEGQVRAGCIA